MKLLARLARVAQARIESSAWFEEQSQRDRSLRPLVQAVTDLAYSADSDPVACERLRVLLLESDPQGTNDAIERLGRGRGSFIDDRAYRLLSAATSNMTVRPIDPAVADLFGREETLEELSNVVDDIE
jgi:hypothetical protein